MLALYHNHLDPVHESLYPATSIERSTMSSNQNGRRSKLRSIIVNSATRRTTKKRHRKGHEKLDEDYSEPIDTGHSYNTNSIMTSDVAEPDHESSNLPNANIMIPFVGPPPFPPAQPGSSGATPWTPFQPESSTMTATAASFYRFLPLSSLIQSHRLSNYPVQARSRHSVSQKINQAMAQFPHQVVGDPSLRIYRLKLPAHLIHILDELVLGCEAHAASLPNGWKTHLYSLTRQDIALRDIPHLYNATKPITLYIKRAMAAMMGVGKVLLDDNQPHVLKYNVEDGHTGVVLHHDKCDVTANLCLSRSTSYMGGGTFFPDANQVVKLEFGEFLLHPGSLVHAGMNIMSGTRHLMVIFGNKK